MKGGFQYQLQVFSINVTVAIDVEQLGTAKRNAFSFRPHLGNITSKAHLSVSSVFVGFEMSAMLMTYSRKLTRPSPFYSAIFYTHSPCVNGLCPPPR